MLVNAVLKQPLLQAQTTGFRASRAFNLSGRRGTQDANGRRQVGSFSVDRVHGRPLSAHARIVLQRIGRVCNYLIRSIIQLGRRELSF